MTKRVTSASLAVVLLIVTVASAGADPTPSSLRPLNILLTNDDGWIGPNGSDTPLIVALRDALRDAGHHVVVVAPGTDQSGKSAALSFAPTFELANPEPGVWTVTPATPSDSVFFAFDEIFADGPPDLVISGMNPSANVGISNLHSGTVNAALTGLELGVPSLAVNVEQEPDWPGGELVAAHDAAAYVALLVRELQASAKRGELMPPGVALNLAYPVVPGPIDPATGFPGSVLPPQGTKATTLDLALNFALDYSPDNGQSGQPGTYSFGITFSVPEGARGTDVRAVNEDYVSLTPFELDRDVNGSTTGWLQALSSKLS